MSPTDPAMTRILELADTLGMVVLDAPPAPYVWDGSFSYRGSDPAGERGPMRAFEVAHELAHWLCADEFERVSPEWGLGREISYGAAAPRDTPRSVPVPRIVEIAVCAIQGVLLAEVDWPTSYVESDLERQLEALDALMRDAGLGGDSPRWQHQPQSREIVRRITMAAEQLAMAGIVLKLEPTS